MEKVSIVPNLSVLDTVYIGSGAINFLHVQSALRLFVLKICIFSTVLMLLILNVSVCSVIVEDLRFLEKIQEANRKRNLCCQITLMLIRYVFLQGILFLRSHYIINVVIHLFSIEAKGHMHTYKRNAMSTIFSQQILSGKLLLVGQKSHINGRFKL